MVGALFIVSGLSGSGKSFLVDRLIERLSFVHRVITTTTRLPREGEADGKNYIFLTKKQFVEKIKQDLLVEWAFVYENFYGTLLSSLELARGSFRAVVVIVDVQGAKTLKGKFPESVSIFIDSDPGIAASRIVRRGNYPGELRQRTAPTEREMDAAKGFDHRIFNVDGSPEVATEELVRIVDRAVVGM